MVNEQDLIAAIRLHAPSHLPGPVSIDGLLSELGINLDIRRNVQRILNYLFGLIVCNTSNDFSVDYSYS